MMIIIILRDGTQQVTPTPTIALDLNMRAVYPKQCGDVLGCKKSFRQQVLSRFQERRRVFLSIPLVDGQIRSFEALLDYVIENYSKYKYAE